MKSTKSNRSTYIMLSLLVFWLFLIFLLSTQPGPDTANTSEGLAVTIAKMLYPNPNKYQIHDVNMTIRKIAHIVLFFVLGVQLVMLCNQRRKKQRLAPWYSASYAFLLFCCFFDEWHKQFIDGRHNDIGDAMLNVLGGTMGMLLVILIYYLEMRKVKEYEEGITDE